MEVLVNRLKDREKLMAEQMAQSKQEVETIKNQYNEIEKIRNQSDTEKDTSVDLKYREWLKSFGNGAKK